MIPDIDMLHWVAYVLLIVMQLLGIFIEIKAIRSM